MAARQRLLTLRLSDTEYKQLKVYAAFNRIGMSEVLRDYIKSLRLPKGRKGE